MAMLAHGDGALLQVCHEKFEAHVLHGAKAAILRAFAGKVLHAPYGAGKRLAHIFADLQLVAHAPLEHARAQFQRP